MSKPYKPHPGSYAEKTVGLLMAMNDGDLVSQLFLAQKFIKAPSAIPSFLNTSVHYGYLTQTTLPDGSLAYGLGPAALAEAGTLTPSSTPQEVAAFERITQRVVSAREMQSPATSGVPSVFHLAGALPTRDPMAVATSFDTPVLVKLKTPKPPVAASADTPAQGARFGLFNNGDLVIRVARGEVTLQRAEARELVDYLEKIRDALATS